MTTYERGYAAGLKAAADVCVDLGAMYCRENILSLPIQGEATNAGTNATQPVAESQAPAPSEPGDRGVAPTLADSRPARSGTCVVVPTEILNSAIYTLEADGDEHGIAKFLREAMLAAAKEE